MITQQWKVENDTNEYSTQQEAQIAECLQAEGAYFTASEKLYVAKQISEKYLLVPIPLAIERKPEAEDLDPYDQKDQRLPA